jgi:hypothetical protein
MKLVIVIKSFVSPLEECVGFRAGVRWGAAI